MSLKDFKTKNFNNSTFGGGSKKPMSDKSLKDFFYRKDSKEFSKPVTSSRSMTIAVVVSVIVGFLSGIVGVIFFFSGSLSFLRVNPEELLPAQQFTIERNEQVNVLEDERIAKVTENVSRSVVSIFKKRVDSENLLEQIYLPSESLGSGFVLTNDGWVTTYVGIMPDLVSDYVVITSNKQVLDVEDIVVDEFSGVAFLKTGGSSLSTLPLSESTELSSGERLLVYFNSFSSMPEVVLSRLKLKSWQDNSTRSKVIQYTDSASTYLLIDGMVSSEYLGGPVVNMSGEVVGLVFKTKDMLLARSVEDFKVAVSQVLSGKDEIVRTDAGMSYIDISKVSGSSIKIKRGESMDVLNRGALVVSVEAGNVAGDAGIVENDIIISVGDREVGVGVDLNTLLQRFKEGESVNLMLLRDGSDQEILVTVNF